MNTSGVADFELDCELCEQKTLFGAAGICVEANSTCLCPSGYTGRDNWLIYPTCHVDEDLAFVLQAVALGLVALGIFSSGLCVVILMKRWNFILGSRATQEDNSKGEENLSRDMSLSHLAASSRNLGVSNQSFRSSVMRSKKVRRAERKAMNLRRDTVLANVFFLVFALCSFVYQFPFLMKNSNGERRTLRDGSPWHQISFCLALIAILSALYLMLLTWFNTLPDVKRFGSLFKLNPFFVRFPNFVRNLTIFMILFSILYSIAFIVVLPVLDEEFYPTMALSVNLVCLFYVGLFGILQWFVISSVMHSFQQGIHNLKIMECSPGDTRLEKQQKVLEKAHFTSKMFRMVGTTIMLACVMLGVLAMIVEQKYQYLIFNLVAGGPYLCTIIFPLGILWKTNGGLKPLPLEFTEITDTHRLGERSFSMKI